MDTEETTSPEQAGLSRRALIQRGAVAAGAAGAVWAAPSILGVSAAGAGTTICYGFKLDGNCTPAPQLTDPTCGAHGGGANSTGSPPAFTCSYPDDDSPGYITAPSGCTITYAVIKKGSGDTACSSASNDGTTASWDAASHVNITMCCPS